MEKIFISILILLIANRGITQNIFPSTGNVGVGTVNPLNILDVRGTSRIANSTGTSMLYFTHGAVTGNTYSEIDALVNSGAWYGNLIFNSGAGNVGIGTTNPTAKLHVNNNILIAPFSPGEQGGYQSGINSRLTILGGDIYDNASSGISFGGMYVQNGVRQSFVYNHLEFGNGFFKIRNNQQNKILIGGGNEWSNQNVIINPDGGNVGIGTSVPGDYKLAVNGDVKVRKLVVSQSGWSDYVFEPGYKLKPLAEVEAFIKKNNHLPDIPSAKEVEAQGISVGENQALLLKKIEELTLYLIELKKENEQIRVCNTRQQQQIDRLLSAGKTGKK